MNYNGKKTDNQRTDNRSSPLWLDVLLMTETHSFWGQPISIDLEFIIAFLLAQCLAVVQLLQQKICADFISSILLMNISLFRSFPQYVTFKDQLSQPCDRIILSSFNFIECFHCHFHTKIISNLVSSIVEIYGLFSLLSSLFIPGPVLSPC